MCYREVQKEKKLKCAIHISYRTFIKFPASNFSTHIFELDPFNLLEERSARWL